MTAWCTCPTNYKPSMRNDKAKILTKWRSVDVDDDDICLTCGYYAVIQDVSPATVREKTAEVENTDFGIFTSGSARVKSAYQGTKRKGSK